MNTITEILRNSNKEVCITDETGLNIFSNEIKNNSIILIGGRQGHGKTRFVTHIVRNIIDKNTIVMWHLMEDNPVLISKLLVSPIINKKAKDIDEYELYNYLDKKPYLDNILFDNNIVNIETIYNTTTNIIETIDKEKIILVIDSVRLLEDFIDLSTETNTYMLLSNVIITLTKKAAEKNKKLIVIMVHHLDDKTYYKNKNFIITHKNLGECNQLKNIASNILLVNNISMYPEILQKYFVIRQYIEKLFIVDIVKDRFNNLRTVRYFADFEKANFYHLCL